jgi:hypothetical protein
VSVFLFYRDSLTPAKNVSRDLSNIAGEAAPGEIEAVVIVGDVDCAEIPGFVDEEVEYIVIPMEDLV